MAVSSGINSRSDRSDCVLDKNRARIARLATRAIDGEVLVRRESALY